MKTERVNDLIDRVMLKHPGQSKAALLNYFEAVHQELAPLARNLERQRDDLDALAKEYFEKLNGWQSACIAAEQQRANLLAALELAVKDFEYVRNKLDGSLHCDATMAIMRMDDAIASAKGGAA